MGFGATAAVLVSVLSLVAQTDADRFAEARIALDKYKDCPAARTALEKINPESPLRQDPIFAFYMARTYECLAMLDPALYWYQHYAAKVPPTAETLDKIGDLRYRLQKQKEADQKAQESHDDYQKAIEEHRSLLSQRLSAIKQAAAALGTVKDSGGWDYSFAIAQSATCQDFRVHVEEQRLEYRRFFSGESRTARDTTVRKSDYRLNLSQTFSYANGLSTPAIFASGADTSFGLFLVGSFVSGTTERTDQIIHPDPRKQHLNVNERETDLVKAGASDSVKLPILFPDQARQKQFQNLMIDLTKSCWAQDMNGKPRIYSR